jgi:hypothetical protein
MKFHACSPAKEEARSPNFVHRHEILNELRYSMTSELQGQAAAESEEMTDYVC